MTNWEFYWDVVSNLALAIQIVIEAYFLCSFVNPFLFHRKVLRDYRVREANLAMRALLAILQNKKYLLLAGAAYAVIMLIQAFIPEEISVMAAYAAGVSAAFLILYFMDRRNAEQKIFLAVVFYLLIWVSWGITLVPWEALYDFLLLSSGTSKNQTLQFILYIIMEGINLLMHCLVMALCIRIMHKEYRYKMENMTRGELVLMLAPLFSIVAGLGIFRFAVNIYEKDTSQYIWNKHYGYSWSLGIYMLVSFVTVLTVIVSWQRIQNSQRKEKEDAVLSGQIEDMKRHIREVEKLYLDIRGLKHDMGNHIMTLERLCGENEEAEEYLRQLKEQVRETASEIKSGNPVTDVILREKQKEAEEKGIAFENRFHFPEKVEVSAFDVGVILNNALSNALEAAGECRNARVLVSSYCAGNAWMIEIENSAAGMRSIEEESGLPFTTKTGTDHGFGLVNIRRAAQKYYGDIDIEQNDGTFKLTVMLLA